jgi:O-methyltransferase
MIREGELIQKKCLRNLESLRVKLYHTIKDNPRIRIAFWGHTYQTAKTITEFEGLFGDNFSPICIIDNYKYSQDGFFRNIPVLPFEEAEKNASQIDLIVIMIDTASIYAVLSQIVESKFADKQLLSIHRDSVPTTESEFKLLCEKAQIDLSRKEVIWYTGEENWFCLYQYLKQTSSLDGDVAEFGVFKGGSAYLMASAMKHMQMDRGKTLYLFDTFEGIPTQSPMDHIAEKSFAGKGLQQVEELFSEFKNVKFIQGDVCQTLPHAGLNVLSLVHIDCDPYIPSKSLCEQLYGKMVRGGIMMFQNYSLGIAYGERIAVDNFFKDKPESVLFGYDGAAFVVKI